MTKRMLIDATHSEETRVVVLNGNKLEDVEFETCSRRQIKGNIYLGKVMRVEPSLQACFVDYGGNKHGFLAFGEIHPDYYNVSAEEMALVDKEVDEVIEAKKQSIKEREAERERIRAERALARAEAERQKAEATAVQAAEAEKTDKIPEEEARETAEIAQASQEEAAESGVSGTKESASPESSEEEKISDQELEEAAEAAHTKKRILKKRIRKQKSKSAAEPLTVMNESAGISEESISEDISPARISDAGGEDEIDADDDDDDQEYDFELQRKLLKARKQYHRSRIQDVIKEGQILLIQIVKEERGNKGAALTTYLSLAGRYCV